MRALGVVLATVLVTAVSGCVNGATDLSCHDQLVSECQSGAHPTSPPGAQLALELPSDLVIAPGAEQVVDLVVKITKLPGTIYLKIDNPAEKPQWLRVSMSASVQGSDAPATRTVRVTIAAAWELNNVTTEPYHLKVRAEQGPNSSPSTVATMTVAYARPYEIGVPARVSAVPGQTADVDVDVVYAPHIPQPASLSVNVSVSGGPPQVPAVPFSRQFDTRTSQRVRFSVPVPAITPIGTYPLQVLANNGFSELTYIVYIDVAAAPPTPDFTLALASTALVAARGATVTTRVSITRTGAPGQVALSVLQPLPNDVRASFTDATGAGNFSDLTLTVGLAAPVGRHSLVLRGVAGAITKDYPFTLDVPAPPAAVDFTLQLAAPTVTIAPNGSISLRIDATRTSGPASQIDLALQGQPANVSLIAAPILASGTSSTIVITAQNAAAGSSTVTVTGTSGGVTRTTSFTLTVVAGGFRLTAPPDNITTSQGSSVTLTIGIQWTGPAAPVTLSTPGLVGGITSTFVPPTTNGAAASLTLDVASTMTPGTYSITVQGAGGGFVASTTVQLVITAITDFALQVSPSAVSVLQLGLGHANVFVSRSASFSSVVTFSVVGAPLGVVVSFAPASTSGTGVELSVTARAYTPPGTYPITVRGTFGTLVRTTSFLLVVGAYSPPSGFILDAETPLTIVRGSATGVTGAIGLLRAAGSSTPVQLTLSGGPSGLTPTFAQNPMLGNITTIRFVADLSVNPGSITVTLTATAGGFTTTAPIRLQIASP